MKKKRQRNLYFYSFDEEHNYTNILPVGHYACILSVDEKCQVVMDVYCYCKTMLLVYTKQHNILVWTINKQIGQQITIFVSWKKL